MANKAISELPQAQNVNNQDLFVIEQGGLAKKLPAETFITEQGIIDALAEALDGHGGIQSVTLASVSGRIRTYRITFSDGSATTFQVYDGTSIERISRTSSSGLQDTYTIFMSDGTTSFFTVTNGADGTVSEAMLNDALKDKAPAVTETTESSAIATFSDGADDLVMHHVIAEINPVQDLSNGDPSPSNICPITGHTEVNVTRTGKLYDSYLDETVVANGLTIKKSSNHRIKISGTITGQVDRYLSTAFIGTGETLNLYITQPVPYTNAVIYVYDTTSNTVALRIYGNTQTSGSFTTVTGHSYRVGILCPNDGKTYDMDFTVSVTGTSPETLAISWQTEAGTVYGGTIDLATGLLTVDRAIVDMGTLNWGHQAGYFYAAIVGIKQTTTTGEYPHVICSSYKTVRQSVWASSKPCVSQISGGNVILVGDDTYSTAADFKAAVTGQTLCYELTTAQTYQLNPQQLMTILGTNNVWADTGNVSVTYPADTKMYIQNLTQPTEDDLVANQAITSGKYFMIGNSLYLALANIASGAQITIGTNAQRVSLADALNTINS